MSIGLKITPYNLRVLLNSRFGNGAWELTSAEVDQLENIDSTTISTTQWGYVGAMDQGVATTDTVSYADLTVTGAGNVFARIISTNTGSALLRFGDSTDNDAAQVAYADALINSNAALIVGTRISGGQLLFRTGDNANAGLWDGTGLAINGTLPTETLDVNGAATFNNNRVKGVATPTATTDAANKAYVDGRFTVSSFSPTLTGDTGEATYTTQQGASFNVAAGFLHFNILIQIATKGTLSGDLFIGGLPNDIQSGYRFQLGLVGQSGRFQAVAQGDDTFALYNEEGGAALDTADISATQIISLNGTCELV